MAITEQMLRSESMLYDVGFTFVKKTQDKYSGGHTMYLSRRKGAMINVASIEQNGDVNGVPVEKYIQNLE